MAHAQYAAAYGVRRASRPHRRARALACSTAGSAHATRRRARAAAALRGPLDNGRHRPGRAAARGQRGGQVAPYYPAAFGFGEDDADFLAEHGFNSVRLGVDFRGLMPTPGKVEYGYIEQLARTVRELGRRGIFVLIDFHQDGFAPKYNGNGLPDWMAIDDGLPNPRRRRLPALLHPEPGDAAGLREPLGEPARARRHRPPGLLRPGRDRGRAALRAVAVRARLRRAERAVPRCKLDAVRAPHGLPGARAATLRPVQREGHRGDPRASRADKLVFVEPFVLFNFGVAPTSLPGAGTGNGLSFHSYAATQAAEPAVVDFAVNAAERDGAPLIATEFGATTFAPTLQRLTKSFDDRLVPWMFWAYNESVIDDPAQPAGLDNLASPDGVPRPRAALSRGARGHAAVAHLRPGHARVRPDLLDAARRAGGGPAGGCRARSTCRSSPIRTATRSRWTAPG